MSFIIENALEIKYNTKMLQLAQDETVTITNTITFQPDNFGLNLTWHSNENELELTRVLLLLEHSLSSPLDSLSLVASFSLDQGKHGLSSYHYLLHHWPNVDPR